MQVTEEREYHRLPKAEAAASGVAAQSPEPPWF